MTFIQSVTPPASSDYTTEARVLAQVPEAAGLPSETLQFMIRAAGALVDGILGWSLGRQRVIERLHTRTDRVFLTVRPIVALVEATREDETIDLATLEVIDQSTGAVLDKDGLGLVVERTRLATWPRAANWAITYDAGYVLPGQEGSDFPAELEMAALWLVREQCVAWKRTPGLQSESLDGYSYSLASADTPDAARVRQLLRQYRRIRL